MQPNTLWTLVWFSFRLDQDSGLITLEGPLDREKQSHYMLLAEARDPAGAANFTKVIVNVLG